VKIAADAAIAYSKLDLAGKIKSSDLCTTTVTADCALAAVATANIQDGAITNTKVNASAAIAYSKLNLANSIKSSDITTVDADKIANTNISTTAAIAYSKLNLAGKIQSSDLCTTTVTADCASAAVATNNIQGSAVTSAKIADGTVTGGTAGAGVDIAANTITKANIASGVLSEAYSNASTTATSTSTTYAAPSTGTAASVTGVSVQSGDKVLVTINTSCKNTNANKGCYMSFAASVASGSPGITHTASDSDVAGGAATVAGLNQGSSASFAFTATGTGTVDFTGKYRVDANTGTFSNSSIIVQVIH
jgi:hypothetical protein